MTRKQIVRLYWYSGLVWLAIIVAMTIVFLD